MGPSTTRVDAEDWLASYEERNSSVPKDTRRLLGLFALATARVPRSVVWEILGHETTVLWRDVSRRWWLALYYSECAKHWNKFKSLAERDNVDSAWVWLISRISKKRRGLVEKRLGVVPRGRPRSQHKSRSEGKSKRLWFKGGTWYRGSPLTKILITGEGLGNVRPIELQWHRKLKPYLRTLEIEARNRVDPDRMSVPHIKWSTLKFVHESINSYLGRKMNIHSAAWFLHTRVPITDIRISHFETHKGTESVRARWIDPRAVRRWK